MNVPIPSESGPKLLINTNTYFSVGLVAIAIGGIWAILTAVTSTKTEVTETKRELNGRFDKIEDRVKNLESAKNVWTSVDMFKWAIHLQQLNKDAKKLQTEGLVVPEPEVNTK